MVISTSPSSSDGRRYRRLKFESAIRLRLRTRSPSTASESQGWPRTLAFRPGGGEVARKPYSMTKEVSSTGTKPTSDFWTLKALESEPPEP